MSTSYTPSELIELFLDGEASADERRTLFDALGRDPELKFEFDDAVRLRSAIARESLLIPPAAVVGAAVFSAAYAMEHESSASPAVAAAVASPVATTFFGATARRVLAAAAAAVIVGETSYIVLHRDQSLMAPSVTTITASSPATPGITPVAGVGTERAADAARRSVIHQSYNPVFHVRENSVAPLSVALDSAASIAPVTFPARFASAPVATIAQSPAAAAPQTDATNLDRTSFDASDEPNAWMHKLTAGLRGVAMLVPSPDRSLDNQEYHLISDAVLDLAYVLSDERVAGISVGRETFPITIVHNDGRHNERPSFYWAGAMYRWMPQALAFTDDLRPYAVATLGGSGFGPLVRATLGAEWHPDTRTSFTLGLESVGLAFAENQTWRSAGKFSIVYGVGVRF